MAKIPVGFKRVAAAFNKASRPPVRPLCESSSGSEHYSSSDDNSADLSDLVNSFIEREYRNQAKEKNVHDQDRHQSHHHDRGQSNKNDQDSNSDWSLSETKDMLENLLAVIDGDDDVRQNIHNGTQLGLEVVGEKSSQGFKRRLMSHLRDCGFDAGLCKCRWEKFGRFPSGDYEYVDVNVDGDRYIVEVFLAGEFEIARPTSHYTELLDVFPQIYIGKAEELKQIVRLMCNAMRESVKGVGMHVAPWRRNGYVQAKWFSHYKRTTNEIPARLKGLSNSDENTVAAASKRAIGFEPLPVRVYKCRDDFASKVGLRVGHLTAAFRGN